MSSIELSNVAEAVERLSAEVVIHREATHTWSVFGEPTAGKTAVLDGLQERLAAQPGVLPILIDPPSRAYDAGHVALVQLAEALTDDQQKLANIKDPERPWEDKLRYVRAWLQRDPSRVVLLADEPRGWAPRDSYFSAFVSDIQEMVFDGLAVAAVTAGAPPFHVRHFHRLDLEPASDHEGVLARIDAPSLTEAREVVAAGFGDALGRMSPLQTRLLVAIAALDADELRRFDPGLTEDRSELVATLLRLVETETAANDLRVAWLRLAAVREPFEDDLLEHLGVFDLADVEQAILRQCLLFQRHDRLVLHGSLRRIPAMTEQLPPGTHELLASYYREKFISSGGDDSGRLRDAVEAFHHASSAGIVALDEYRPFFVEQLNILGYHLSYEQRNFESAAAVFGTALKWDPDNPYALHYRAFNLERLARDPQEVESLYRRAVERAPGHTWFRSRLISFLISEARIDDAWREWLLAIDALDVDRAETFYYSLHLHVARMFVYRGELTFAETVLRAVPAHIRRDPRFVAIADRLEVLRETNEVGSHVPAPLMRPEWWRYGPNLLHDDVGGIARSRWLAGRVTAVDEDVIVLDVADVVGTERPVYGAAVFPHVSWAAWWEGPGRESDLKPGTFVEVGFYGDGETTTGVAIAYPKLRWRDLTRHDDDDPDRFARVAAKGLVENSVSTGVVASTANVSSAPADTDPNKQSGSVNGGSQGESENDPQPSD
jgi:tetratricopeptide (TPR) repeat protein